MSLFGVDADALKVLVPGAAIALSAAIAGAYQVATSRRTAAAQITAAEVAARTTATIEAGRIAQATKSDTERFADNRAQRVSDEMQAVVVGFQALIDRQSTQIDRQSGRIDKLEAKLTTQDATIRTQRRDMDEVARQKDDLVERVADLETADKLKTALLDRLRTRLTMAYDYISLLTKQLIDHGHEPPSPPPGLRTHDEKGADRG